MLLRCTLMRHGEAGRSHEKGDQYRVLTSRGGAQARQTAAEIEALGWAATMAAHSVATRTDQTMAQVAKTWTTAPALNSVAAFYLGDIRHIETWLSALSSDVQSVLLVGHNPGWSQAASHLTGVRVGMDVADAALMSIEAESWAEACACKGLWTLDHFISNASLAAVGAVND